MKRILVLLICVLLLVMTACAEKSSVTNGGDVQKPETKAQSNETDGDDVPKEKQREFVELNYYIRASEQDDSEVVQEAMDEYLTEALNCTVKIIPVSEWTTKMPLTLSSGEQVDLVFDQTNTGYYTNVANNVYLPLDDLLKEYGQGIIETVEQNAPGLLEAPKVNGVLYGIPCQKQTAQCEAWYFRKDIVEKYQMDIDSLVTLQDLEPYLKIIKENEPDMIPYYVSAGTGAHMEWTTDAIKDDPYRYEELNGAINLLLVDLKTDKVINRYETEWDRDRYETLKRWQDLGYINSDAATTSTSGVDMFKAGKTWLIGGGGAPTTMGTYEQIYGTEFVRWRATGPVVNTYQNTTALTCITRTTADAERAMEVINLFHTDADLINLFNSGIQGRHYVIDENGRFALPEGKTSRSDTGYSYGFETFFGNMFLNSLWYNEAEDRYDELREYNRTSRKSKIMGFYVNMEDITTEYAAVEAIRTQYAPLLKGGVVKDVEATLAELNEKMYANGLQTIIDSVQAQYDAFVEAGGKTE
jgi:putative aldouronate transport system substrate-binding protein